VLVPITRGHVVEGRVGYYLVISYCTQSDAIPKQTSVPRTRGKEIPVMANKRVSECLGALGVTSAILPPCCSAADEFQAIKKLYFAAALASHPDKGGSPASFREIQESWEVLRELFDSGKSWLLDPWVIVDVRSSVLLHLNLDLNHIKLQAAFQRRASSSSSGPKGAQHSGHGTGAPNSRTATPGSKKQLVKSWNCDQ
jgi:hypothetical protein